MTETTKEPKNWRHTLPNHLTIFRIAAVPIILLLYPLQIPTLKLFLAFLFAIAAITDWLDGFIARQFNSETKLGKVLDPVADKVLCCAGLVLLAQDHRWLSGLFGLLLCREFVVNGMRVIAAEKNVAIPVAWMGKWKTVSLDVAVVCLMVNENLFGWPWIKVGHASLWIGAALSLFSGYLYSREFWKKISL